MIDPIDLRSDTVTRPTLAMRKAMANAEVGDDVMGEDPSVIALEERVAGLFKKESSLFVPSGTMANLLAILSQTSPGDEILTHRESHIYYYEAGGYAAIAGCSVKFVDDSDAPKPGVMTARALRGAVRPPDIHFPSPTLFTIENTHNRGGGVVWPMDILGETCAQAKSLGLRVHTDGARIWNASIASGISLDQLAAQTDTLSVCLSKGLGCPAGSMLVGDQETITRARHKRKMLGGAMRQAGILAAAGLYALDNHFDRLAIDHTRAKCLAEELAGLVMFDFDPDTVETNLVYAKLSRSAVEAQGDAFVWENRLKSEGVLCFAESQSTLRFVTHQDLDDPMIQETGARIRRMCRE
jgi:threonine aldolase